MMHYINPLLLHILHLSYRASGTFNFSHLIHNSCRYAVKHLFVTRGQSSMIFSTVYFMLSQAISIEVKKPS